MKTNRSVTMRIISASLLVAGLVAVGAAQRIADPERKNLLVSAANAYYNARELGLSEFSCVAKPDWAAIVGSAPADAEGLKFLNAQHFYVKLNAENNVELIHKSDFPPPKEFEKDLKDLEAGMREMTTGFFGVWAAFALRNPFPEPGSKCEVLSSVAGYEIRCDDPAANVVTVVKKDLSITEIRVKAPNTTTIMRPVFNKTPEGFIISGYNSDADMPDGGKVKSHVEVVYDGQEAYQLPVRIKFDGSVGNERVKLDLILTDYQVTRKKS
jgi:hypothetical protein